MKRVMALVLGLGIVGCSASQQQADAALEAAQEVITAQHAEALRFAPDAFAAVMERYGVATASYDAQDWAAAIEAAEETAAQARQLTGAIADGRARAAADWPAMRDKVAEMLAMLDGRVADALRTRQYPEGVTADGLRAVQARIDTLETRLADADRGMEADLAGALHAAEQIRAQAGSLMVEAGLRPRNPHGG